LQIDKDLPDAQIAYGFYYYYCKKDYLNALRSFTTASVMEPENCLPLFYMAIVYRKMGEWDMSQNLMHRVMENNPQEPLYLTNIGLSFTYLHNYDTALIYHQKAIDLNPEWPASYANKIETLVLKYGNTTEARKVLDSLENHAPERYNEIKIILDIYDRMYDQAFSEADNSSQDDFVIKGNKYLYLAKISNLLNNKVNAEKYYDAALAVLNLDVSRDSTNAEIHGLIGIANAGKGNKELAIAEGKKAIALTILDKNKLDESDMIVNLAKIYLMLGLTDEALSNIEYSLKNPSLLSAKLLAIDPVWKPLANYPEFKTLIAKYNHK
jgi:tetratricopeptide (TPR) repeat protein